MKEKEGKKNLSLVVVIVVVPSTSTSTPSVPVLLLSVHLGLVHRQRLPPVHVRHLRRARRLLGLLVVALADEAGEADADPLVAVDEARRRFVDRRDRQIRCLDLPYHSGLEPHIRNTRLPVSIIGPGLRDDVRRELGSDALELLLAEPRPDFGDRLVRLGAGVVDRQEKGAKAPSALASAVPGAEDDDVEGVADAVEVVL